MPNNCGIVSLLKRDIALSTISIRPWNHERTKLTRSFHSPPLTILAADSASWRELVASHGRDIEIRMYYVDSYHGKLEQGSIYSVLLLRNVMLIDQYLQHGLHVSLLFTLSSMGQKWLFQQRLSQMHDTFPRLRQSLQFSQSSWSVDQQCQICLVVSLQDRFWGGRCSGKRKRTEKIKR